MPRKSKSTTESIATLGIDIGKNVFHLIGLDKRGAIVEQGGDLRSSLQGLLGYHAHDCRRPQTFGRQNRHHQRPAHLGVRYDPPSPRAHDRHRWWHLSRWIAVGRLTTRLSRAVEVLSALFRGRMLGMLIDAHAAARLQFFGDYQHLADTR